MTQNYYLMYVPYRPQYVYNMPLTLSAEDLVTIVYVRACRVLACTCLQLNLIINEPCSHDKMELENTQSYYVNYMYINDSI